MPVRIAHLHLIRPGEVSRSFEYVGSARDVLAVQRTHVVHTYPGPCAGIPLISLRQVDTRATPTDEGEVCAAPLGIREPEHVYVVANAARQVIDPQDRIRAFEFRS